MKQNTKRIFALGVLCMLVAIFAVSLVAAANPIGDWFAKWEDAQFSANIAKYLFWALVSMAVYSIGSKIPGLKTMFSGGKEWLGGAFSIIVGFLAMAYITPSEVYAIMISYSAMGFVLAGALPFIILLAFTFTLATDRSGSSGEKLGRKAIAVLMWIAFVIFIVYKVFIGTGAEGSSSGWISVAQWAILIVSILILVFIGSFFRSMGKLATKEDINVYRENVEKATGKTKADAAAVEDVADGEE